MLAAFLLLDDGVDKGRKDVASLWRTCGRAFMVSSDLLPLTLDQAPNDFAVFWFRPAKLAAAQWLRASLLEAILGASAITPTV